MGDTLTNIRKFAAPSLLALAIATPALAVPPDFKAKADALLAEAYPADGPGASVVVTEHGKIIYQGSRGLADVEAKRPIDPQTVFRMGSITKQFAAAVVLQLAAEGKIKLGDPISTYLPAYPPPANTATVAQLLNHTSGIQSYTSIPGWMVEANTARSYTTEQLVAVFKDLPPPSKPGEQWSYNNSGYVLVGALIEAVTGQPWQVEVDRRIVKPLGLKSIRYGVEENAVPAMAKGYTINGGKLAPSMKIHMSVPAAAGALLGTPTDLAAWGYALHHNKVVSPPFYAQMIAPTKLSDGSSAPYGFGIEPESLRGETAIGHSGGIFGFSTDSIYVPSKDIFVAVFANSDSPATAPAIAMRRLAALAIDNPFPAFQTIALDSKAVEPMLGVYRFADTERVVSMRDGKIYARRRGAPEAEVHPAGEGRFHYGPNELSWFRLAADSAGKPVMEMHGNGNDEPTLGQWSGPVPAMAATVALAPEALARFVGTYESPMGKLEVTRDEAGLTLHVPRQQPAPLRPISDHDFMFDRVEAKISFSEKDGKVSGLVIDQGGKQLPATRD